LLGARFHGAGTGTGVLKLRALALEIEAEAKIEAGLGWDVAAAASAGWGSLPTWLRSPGNLCRRSPSTCSNCSISAMQTRWP